MLKKILRKIRPRSINPSLKPLATLLLMGVSVGFSFSVSGRPIVSDNVISWPDNAWYQVENRQTGEIVCQGGSSCTVPDGIYWVSWFWPDGSGGGSTRVIVGNPSALDITNETFAETLVVNGRTLSWSVPGWYQVQDAQSFSTICNGESGCTVPSDGRYIVINHSIGRRAELTVGDTSLPPGGEFGEELLVGAGLISWSDDGWYQVQNAQTFETVCEGGSACEVSSGVYIVVNHSTGRRFENVVVGDFIIDTGVPDADDTNPANPAGIQVIGNEISWTGDGWFQVQDADSYQTVCEGGNSCLVSSGRYQVINHSTGTRFDIIEISESAEPSLPGQDTPGNPILNAENMHDVVRQAFEVLTGRAFDRRFVEFPYHNSNIPARCSSGEIEFFPSRFYANQGDLGFDSTSRFNNCVHLGETVNGRVYTNYDESSNGLLTRDISEDFRVDISEDTWMELGGSYTIECCESRSTFTTRDFNYFFTYSAGSLAVSNANTYLSHGDDNLLAVGGSFDMRPPALANASVSVRITDEFFNDNAIFPNISLSGPGTYRFRRGRMEITAADSQIIVDASAGSLGDINLTLITPDGSESTMLSSNDDLYDGLKFSLPPSNHVIDGTINFRDNRTFAVITESNYVDLIGYAFDVFRGAEFGSSIVGLPAYSNPYYMDDSNAFWGVQGGGLGPVTTENCAASGSANFTPYHAGFSQTTSGFNFRFEQCNDGLTTYNGNFVRRNFGNLANSSGGLTLTTADENIFFSGQIDYKRRSNRDGSPTRFYQLSDVRYNSDSATAPFALHANFNRFEVLSGLNLRSINGEFTVQSAATGNLPIFVSTLDTLGGNVRTDESPEGPLNYFRSGSLRLSAGFGNRVILRADNGNRDTVTIELINNGEIAYFEHPWSLWADHIGFLVDL